MERQLTREWTGHIDIHYRLPASHWRKGQLRRTGISGILLCRIQPGGPLFCKMPKHVAIIGAGASGLAAIKCCLDDGLKVTCFEMDSDIGGLWRYTEDSKPGKGSVYKSCVINTSKEMLAFSDFPVPEEFPPFMPHDYMLRYIRMYADAFKLMQYIEFNRSVECVTPAVDYEVAGRWQVASRQTGEAQSQGLRVEEFDAVLVCSGHHVFPHVPCFPGLDSFRGCKMHSHDYRQPAQFEGKRVLVIGIGNSAVDIAVDISRTAEQVYLSTRRGAWIVARLGPMGYPADALANSRCMFTLPRSTLQWMVECMANFRFNHTNYGLQPQHRSLEAHPTINDDLPHRIMVGKVLVKPSVKQFGCDFVEFTDGTDADIDAVILATGYDYRFRFLDDSLVSIKENEVELYKFMFPPHLQHPTLAIIGLVQAIGSVLPIAEMQARWCAKLIKGETGLPSEDARRADIMRKKGRMGAQYVPSRRHHLQTFWIEYMDEIADMIGVRPPLFKMLFTEPSVALRCFFGPCIPAQYRLVGPGASTDARHTIRHSLWRNVAATRTRTVEGKPCNEGFSVWFKCFVLLAVSFFSVVLCQM